MKRPARLIVLISGNGSNLQAIIDACASQQLQAEIVSVISNKADAYGLERARKAHIPTRIQLPKHDQERHEYDAELAKVVASYQPDWIILAGWMRILSLHFLKHFPNKVINLHPALPGMYPGTKAIERAFADYQAGKIQHTGIMVHLVPDEDIDCGPILAQTEVAIFPHDTLTSLVERMHKAEHQLLVTALKKQIANN
jgi:formyltetrahydrofolate-dependent phosphoribosylglycinamide formyltransferase